MLFDKIKLESDEEVLKIVHKHWFVYVRESIQIGLAAFVPLLGWMLLQNTSFAGIHIDGLADYRHYFWYFYTLWLLFQWMIFAYMVTDKYLDLWVITDRRIISINQKALFRRSIASFRLERLQDINVEINGIIATFLDFGKIEAETAGENDDEFKSFNIPHPREIKATILAAADKRMPHQHNL